ncbi:lipase maturation factor family protein [Hoyosella subflava]|uniref:Putative integral membrane protein n=1 Tax=Hoyosella subflava (strain DSM 45089 / JCM 17490 / NBRC 109087 / DQS3-9A1) TaxID=443218 RepID=F6EQD7_HOYSD|nr:lipase maturation factor family protein [Hoyosella subflava]AEF40622.1 Putative integral membrane protein [Hoyosella subflava DQS3-9A1]
MEWFGESGYWLSRWMFQRGLGLVYLVAFLVAANQFRALIGSRGLTPIPRYLAQRSWRQAPSIFHIYYSDRFFAVVAWCGAGLAGAAMLGLGDLLPLGASMAMWALLWILYLSIVNVGQAWYGFGWESLLLEVGFLAIFIGAGPAEPPVLVLFLLRWVLFRLEFGAGMIKMHGDRCWRDFTCLYYHHETQPMPNPLSWHFHHLPKPLHRIEVAGNHFAQLVVPFFLFAPQPVASIAALIIIITQAWLVVSGNFAWLNVLTIVLALSVVDGSWWATVLPIEPPAAEPVPGWQAFLVVVVTVLVAALSYRPARNLFSRHQLMNYSFDKLHLVNTYGAFGRVTRTRYEVILEGSNADEPTDDAVWREYDFKGKPGDPYRRPRQFAPYHLRLDWLMWFAAVSPRYAKTWLPRLARKLVENDSATLKLLRHNPFAETPPRWVRARMYVYRFTTRAERERTGAWWHREFVSDYMAPVGRG